MAIRKPISVALSSVALAGVTVFATGAASPAGAETVAATSQRPVAVQDCGWRWNDCHRWGWHRWHHHDGWHHHDSWHHWSRGGW